MEGLLSGWGIDERDGVEALFIKLNLYEHLFSLHHTLTRQEPLSLFRFDRRGRLVNSPGSPH